MPAAVGLEAVVALLPLGRQERQPLIKVVMEAQEQHQLFLAHRLLMLVVVAVAILTLAVLEVVELVVLEAVGMAGLMLRQRFHQHQEQQILVVVAVALLLLTKHPALVDQALSLFLIPLRHKHLYRLLHLPSGLALQV
jgi:hypothetical protein